MHMATEDERDRLTSWMTFPVTRSSTSARHDSSAQPYATPINTDNLWPVDRQSSPKNDNSLKQRCRTPPFHQQPMVPLTRGLNPGRRGAGYCRRFLHCQ